MHSEVPNPDSKSLNSREKEKWGRKTEYLLATLGYMVGLGNLWRFPYLCMKNGGGAFLIPFILCITVIAFPLFYLEVSLGQFTAKSTIYCWEACPLFKGLGWGMVMLNGMGSIFLVMILTWPLYYAINSFFSPLPWTSCDNAWNTMQCSSASYLNDLPWVNTSLVNATKLTNGTFRTNLTVSSVEEFWRYGVLNMSSGIEDMGSVNIYVLLCLIGSWFIVYLCLIRGVKSIGKVVYVTATLPYALLLVLFVRGVTLPGAIDGILYFITPRFSRLANFQVWSEAAIQVFYSTCVCIGPLITMASHNKFNNNSFRDSLILLTIGEGTSIIAGCVIFSILGFMAHSTGQPITEVVISGPGLAFIVYPEAVAELPTPQIWALLFFVMLLTLGIDSLFSTLEMVIELLCDSYTYIRKRRPAFTALIITIYCLLGIPFCFQGGIYLFQLVDWYILSFAIPLFGIGECVVFGWIYGADKFSNDIQLMTGRPVPTFLRMLWCFVTPFVLLVLFLIIVTTYKLPMLGDYSYPAVANVFGMFLAVFPILPVFIVGFIEIRRANGTSLNEKLRNSMKPSLKWQPGYRNVTRYDVDQQERYIPFKQRIKLIS